jgi:hypothetical protein
MLGYNDVLTLVNLWGIELRVTRLRNLALLVYGILSSRSGCLSAIVRSWSMGSAQHTHRLKRLHRFLKNPDVSSIPVFRAAAAISWLHRPGGNRTSLFPVILDWTKVHAFHAIFAAMPRRKRALPLAFGVYHPDRLRHSQNKLERGLCTLVASLLPTGVTPLFLADAGFGYTEFIRWLQHNGFAFVVRLRPDTLIHYRGRTVPLGTFDTIEGAPILLSRVRYRKDEPVPVNIVVSRLGDSVWYLGTSFRDADQTILWYKKRFWIEEMFRDLKSTLGLRKAHLDHEDRIARLLLGYQIAYSILALIGLRAPNRWQKYLSSRPRLSFTWLALEVLKLVEKRRHRKVWCNHIWPALIHQTG